MDFAAKAFNKAQQNYNAAKRELLAGLYAMNRWRPWLLFRKFTWGLDSKAVSFINTSTNRVVLDWINIFMDFDFETRFKRGILNVLPHQLSHMYDMLQLDFGRGENLGDVEMGLLESGVKQVGSVVAVARGVGSGFDQSTKKFIQEKLLKEAPPVEERLKLVADTHKQSHMGFKMLFKMLWEDGYFWDSMWFDCEKEVARCRPCQVFNVGRCGFQPMSTIVAKRPWDHIAMDLIGLLKCSERGFVFILIIIDVLTRFVVLKPLRTKEAKEIAYALVKVFANYGVPKMIQFDNEATFLSKIIEELRFVSGFEARNIMKYNPRQNGVVERFVAETKRVLMKWLHGDVSGWEYFIPAVQMGLNDQILLRHNSRPFSLMFGRRMNGFEEFRDWAHDKVYSEEETEELLKELKTWGEEIWKIVSKESEAIGTRHTERGNKRQRDKSRVKNFKVGDLVLKKIVNRRNKMGKRWEGPFEILAFDEKQKGYRVREMEGKFLNDLILADQLRRVAELADEESVSWEVVKILNHKGKVGDRLYLVEWKGGFKPTWEPESAIQTTDCIQDYWDAKKKSKSKGKEKSSKGSRRGSSSSSASSSSRGRGK